MGALGALIAACLPEPIHPAAGQPEAGTPADCVRACERLRTLNCPEGSPTLGPDARSGTGDESTCEQTCIDVEGSGYTTVNPKCAAEIGSCAELEGCGWSAE